MKRAWFIVLPTLAIGFGFLAAPLLAQSNFSPEFVYVANGQSEPTLSGYYVDPSTGALTFSQNTVSFTYSKEVGGRNPSSLAVNPSGDFLYVAYGESNNAVQYSIVPNTGVLSPHSGPTTGMFPISLAVDPNGRFVYVANRNSRSISGYRINNNGFLAPIGNFANGTEPFSVAVDSTGHFVYVANFFTDTVSGYRIDEKTGELAPIGSFTTGLAPISVAADPKDPFVYVANFNSRTVSGYRIADETGKLTDLSFSPFQTGRTPRSLTVDPKGQFLFVVNEIPATLSVYTIHNVGVPDGVLTPILDSPFATGTTPVAVAVDPAARFVYVANQDSNSISGYSLDENTIDHVRPIGSFGNVSHPQSIAIRQRLPIILLRPRSD
jgi:6-phosphogluconolactonase (cycloisomerase 2 family)